MLNASYSFFQFYSRLSSCSDIIPREKIQTFNSIVDYQNELRSILDDIFAFNSIVDYPRRRSRISSLGSRSFNSIVDYLDDLIIYYYDEGIFQFYSRLSIPYSLPFHAVTTQTFNSIVDYLVI